MAIYLFVFVSYLIILLSAQQQSIYRLPTTIKPIFYNVTLYPNFVNFKSENSSSLPDLEGWEYITINISINHVINNNPNDLFQVIIHQSIEVNVSNINLIIPNDSTYSSINITFNANLEMLSIQFPLTNNQILSLISTNTFLISSLYIHYTSKYRSVTNGIFISSYNYNNITIYNLVTQFESINARSAFPCFDEPSFKSIFQFRYIAPINATVLNNADIININKNIDIDSYQCYYEYSSGLTSSLCQIVQFDVTPVMSTYLNTFVIGDYQYIAGINKYINNLQHNIYYPWNRLLSDVEWAYNISQFTVYYFGSNSIFNMDYISLGISKLDDIGITRRPSAMEHWGLVTYDTRRLLTNPKISDLQGQILCILVIGHELVHQWFGNLVTANWWNNMFINEGFARFYEYISADAYDSTLNVFDYFVTRTNNRMNNDITMYTRPIVMNENDIQTISEIKGSYPNVVYDKGAAILRMIDNFMGRASLLNASKEFLNIYKYDNAGSDQVIQIFNNHYDNQSGDTDFIAFFNSWLTLSGIPVLNITITNNNDNDDELIINIMQQRMVKQNVNNNDAQYDELWYIPLIIQTANANISYRLGTFNSKEFQFSINRVINNINGNNIEYYLFNTKLINYFRTIYDENTFSQIISNFNYLSFWDEFNIISDYSSLMEYSYIDGDIYLDLLYKITDKLLINDQDRDELSYQVWDIIINSLYSINDKFCMINYTSSSSDSFKDLRDNFNEFVIDILDPIYKDVNEWNQDSDDSEHIIRLRTDIITALITFNNKNVIEYGYNLLLELMEQNDDTIPLDVDGNIDISLNDQISSDLISPMLAASLLMSSDNNDDNILNQLISIYSNSNDELKNNILESFGVLYNNYNLSNKAYNFIMSSESEINNNLKVNGINYLSNCLNVEFIWNKLYIDNNGEDWIFLYDLGYSRSQLIRLPIKFITEYKRNEVNEFYDNVSMINLNAYENVINETLEQIDSNLVWSNQNKISMNNYLINYINNKQKKDDDKGLKTWEVTLIIISSILVFIIILLMLIPCIIRRNRHRETYQTMDSNDMDLNKYGSTK